MMGQQTRPKTTKEILENVEAIASDVEHRQPFASEIERKLAKAIGCLSAVVRRELARKRDV